MILRRCVARFSLVRHFPGSGLGRGAGSQDDFCVVPWYALLSKPAKSSWSLPEPVFCTVFHDFQGVSLRVSEGFRRGFLGVSKGFRVGFKGFLLRATHKFVGFFHTGPPWKSGRVTLL